MVISSRVCCFDLELVMNTAVGQLTPHAVTADPEGCPASEDFLFGRPRSCWSLLFCVWPRDLWIDSVWLFVVMSSQTPGNASF